MTSSEHGREGGLGYGFALAGFASFFYVALVVCVFGVLSLLLDQDVVPERDAGPVLGPASVAACVLAVLIAMITLAARPAVTHVVGPSVLTGVVVSALYVVVGAALYGLGANDPAAILGWLLAHVSTAFTIAIGVVAAVVQSLFLLVLARHDAGGRRPRWGWEGDERE
ncbi:DUF6121 family protein [Rathayibacter toxicus]|uniref:Uncharacterized protein n=1 Tax=Rathayibacter toxicus TaxID=145458 RepID=A0A0C5BG27_9MICO|nr:DUF6121 family protein [Rathayibacter toxicus]AJM77155.1 hypothetical protein TI83_02655 [Rathayibacter toxicus]ALS57001.1 hypothetical protein APU90_03815 [Rathayibacter toxicus]KKM46170.1 hypothetical protein VT73_03680 [Rathayibacter toxicus]PPG23121.1 hypothetical protein C5D15_02440 [Rathayibacter toxicus]PPG47704.1 hypothetical protein C5D16_02435 [Rathayibacter toxicus]